MRFCENCGKAMAENSHFCPSCGTRAGASSPSPSQGGRYLRCPSCKSTMISPIVESTNTGGIAVGTRVTKRMSVTGYSSRTTHRNYWMCQTCGNKFRNIQNLAGEIKSEKTKMRVCLIMGAITLLFAIFVGIKLAESPRMITIMAFPMVMLAVVTISMLCIGLVAMFRVKRMKREKEYLEVNCFR